MHMMPNIKNNRTTIKRQVKALVLVFVKEHINAFPDVPACPLVVPKQFKNPRKHFSNSFSYYAAICF